jgi:CBS domain-containing protein
MSHSPGPLDVSGGIHMLAPDLEDPDATFSSAGAALPPPPAPPHLVQMRNTTMPSGSPRSRAINIAAKIESEKYWHQRHLASLHQRAAGGDSLMSRGYTRPHSAAGGGAGPSPDRVRGGAPVTLLGASMSSSTSSTRSRGSGTSSALGSGPSSSALRAAAGVLFAGAGSAAAAAKARASWTLAEVVCHKARLVAGTLGIDDDPGLLHSSSADADLFGISSSPVDHAATTPPRTSAAVASSASSASASSVSSPPSVVSAAGDRLRSAVDRIDRMTGHGPAVTEAPTRALVLDEHTTIGAAADTLREARICAAPVRIRDTRGSISNPAFSTVAVTVGAILRVILAEDRSPQDASRPVSFALGSSPPTVTECSGTGAEVAVAKALRMLRLRGMAMFLVAASSDDDDGDDDRVDTSTNKQMQVVTATDIARFLWAQRGSMRPETLTRTVRDAVRGGSIHLPTMAKVSIAGTLQDALAAMQLAGTSRAACVDDQGRLTTTISESDLRDVPLEALPEAVQRPIREHVRELHGGHLPLQVTCTWDTTIRAVLHNFVRRTVHSIWIVDVQCRPLACIDVRTVLAALMADF